MFRFRRQFRSGVAALCVLLAGLSTGFAKPVVTGVRTGEQAAMTRFVLDIDAPVEFRIFTLPDPYRVVIDLPEVEWRVPARMNGASGVIKGLRFGLFSPGVSRVVLDVARPVEVNRAFLLPPQGAYSYRFVVDLAVIDEARFRQTARLATPPAAILRPALAADKLGRRPDGKRVVAIDPGHGGIDPGTIGASGVAEKTITLAIARELRRRLAATGRYHVVLTRERDIFVRLRDRVAKARKAGAELFLSLHADSIENRRLRGSSVYTLSEEASDAEAAALAAKENKADIIAGIDFQGVSEEVANILIDLAQREAKDSAARFANRVLVPALAKAGKVLRKSHRRAGFAVLKAPDVPSVLIEMGYLSNRQDEHTLTNAARRKKLIAAIAGAVDTYFKSLKE